jgi:hypothetical protein
MACNCPRSYGALNFLFDLFMVAFTGGAWMIWIFIREMRRRKNPAPATKTQEEVVSRD